MGSWAFCCDAPDEHPEGVQAGDERLDATRAEVTLLREQSKARDRTILFLKDQLLFAAVAYEAKRNEINALRSELAVLKHAPETCDVSIS